MRSSNRIKRNCETGNNTNRKSLISFINFITDCTFSNQNNLVLFLSQNPGRTSSQVFVLFFIRLNPGQKLPPSQLRFLWTYHLPTSCSTGDFSMNAKKYSHTYFKCSYGILDNLWPSSVFQKWISHITLTEDSPLVRFTHHLDFFLTGVVVYPVFTII